jgi:hypothetical protein
MTQISRTPQCGDWFKLVEVLAIKKQGEYGEEVSQGDLFRFLGFSAAEGYAECYSPRLRSRFWLQLEYLIPIQDTDLISLLEPEVPEPFKRPISEPPPAFPFLSRLISSALQQKTKEIS